MKTKERRTDCRGHVVWSENDRNELLEEYSKSRQTKKAFCLERGVNLGAFYGWAKQKRKETKVSKPKFQEFSVPVAAGHAVEVILPCGARVCLAGNGNQAELANLIRGIAGC